MTDPAPRSDDLRRRLATGGAWAVVGRGGTLALNFLTFALVTRLLPPEQAGAYFLAQTAVNLTAMAARLGLESTVVYLVSSALGEERPDRARRAIRRVIGVGTLSAACFGLVLSLFGGRLLGEHVFHSALFTEIAPWLGPWSAALALQMLFGEAFRGFHGVREAVLFGGLVTGVLSVGALVGANVLHGHASLGEAVLIALASTALNLGLAGVTLRVRARELGALGESEPGELERMAKAALPVLGNNAMGYVLLNVDVWVVGSHLPEREVAAYSAAARLVALVQISLLIANQVLPPIIGELHARGERERLERVLRGVAGAMAPPALLILAVFVLFGPAVLRLGFGAFYAEGAVALSVLSVGQLVAVLTGASVPVLLMTGNQRAAVGISGAAAVVATVAALLAVGPFGTTGVAVATSAVIVVQQLATLVAARRLAHVWTHASFGLARSAVAEVLAKRKAS